MSTVIQFFLVVLAAAGFVYFGVPWLHARLLRAMQQRLMSKKKMLLITFDDGPGEQLTTEILRVLKEHNSKATFFLLGKHIAGREEMVRLILEHGHEIGCHGYEHVHHWSVWPHLAIRDIRRGFLAIDKALGVTGRKYSFRPPHGKLTLLGLAYLLWSRVPIVYWTFDSGDTWAMLRDPQRAARLLRRTGGGILLAHDHDRPRPEASRWVIESIRSVLTACEQENIRALTYSQYLKESQSSN